MKFPIFNEINISFLIKEIAIVLKESIFLPNDYIVYKDDIGMEMYFIIEGKVHVLSPKESQVIKTLEKGNYFGEIALFSVHAKRICSVMAASFCRIYVLDKKSLESLTNKYPILQEKLQEESNFIFFFLYLNQFKKFFKIFLKLMKKIR